MAREDWISVLVLLGLVALPYFMAMASDLRACGYKRMDVVRIYGFNLILLPVNLAGTVSSLVQGITASKAPFARTPKVRNRTVSPPFFVVAPYLLIILAGITFYFAYRHGLVENMVYAAINVLLAIYATIAFIGLRNSIVDAWVHTTALLRKPVNPPPPPTRLPAHTGQRRRPPPASLPRSPWPQPPRTSRARSPSPAWQPPPPGSWPSAATGSAGSRATCWAPPGSWPRRWGSCWRRRRGEPPAGGSERQPLLNIHYSFHLIRIAGRIDNFLWKKRRLFRELFAVLVRRRSLGGGGILARPLDGQREVHK